MLPESARAVIGVPHPSGRAAMQMLEREGFEFDGYVDIFDGGPTMARTPTRSAPSANRAQLVLVAASTRAETVSR